MFMRVSMIVRDVVDLRLTSRVRPSGSPRRRHRAGRRPSLRRAVVAVVAVVGLGASATASYRYTVRPGDTLSAIAERAGTSGADLLATNHLANADRIYAGQALLVGSPAAAPASGYPTQLLRHSERFALLPSFRHWAAASRVPVDLLEAMTWMESGWQNGVVSSTGALGVGQLEPSTVRFVSAGLLGVRLDPHVPDDNIRMTAAYLAWILRQSGGRVDLGLAYYYQGIGSVSRRGMMPETRHYVRVITLLRPAFAAG